MGVLLMMYTSCKYTMLCKSSVRQVDDPSVRNVNLLDVVLGLVQRQTRQPGASDARSRQGSDALCGFEYLL